MPSVPRVRTSYMARRDGPLPAEDDPLLSFAAVLHKQPRKNSIGPDRQRKFIAALAASGIVTDAARVIGATVEALYQLRHREGAEEFAAAWDAAVDRAMARVEGEALARAIDGVERPILSCGKLLGWYRVHNEALVTFLLRHRRPERYGAVPKQELRPGHPEYERIRQELRKREPDIEEVRAELLRKVAAMDREKRRKWAAAWAWAQTWGLLQPRPDGADSA